MPEISAVGVVGAGTMGHGIAQVAAQAGWRTTLYDVTEELSRKGLLRIADNLDAGIAKGKVTAEKKAEAMGRLRATGELKDLAGCQLIIEAAPEDLPVKQKLFQKLSEVAAPDAILASNTSSLSLTEIAAAATHPERVVGMHFFNPVHVMKLLELVRAYQTSGETLAAVQAAGERMGKQVIVVKDHPGFASSRLGIALGMEAIRMLEEGVASAEDIDRAMELGYGHPMGPLKLTDLVGLDVRLAIAEYLHRELGTPSFRPPQLLKKMVRAGKLGKKSGEGFYRY
ncbi:MAG TPA: 3-hydroxyacyl-CoA dehydrogenase family protein [Myxococcaceae bacterium]|nr:3-hydroxyacyl-CoA dehydrogenase family protein [Myxococcaceae bacterium]